MGNFVKVTSLLMLAGVAACGSSNETSVPSSSNTNSNVTTGDPYLSFAPGAGKGATLSARIVNQAYADYERISTAIDNEEIRAPAFTPTSTAQMNGYVGLMIDDTVSVVGNLTIDADFSTAGGGTVTSTASDFAEFDDATGSAVPSSTLGITGGTLSGSGNISRTSISSTLNGVVTSANGDNTINSNMIGQVYNENGRLLVKGDVSGTIVNGRNTVTTDGGEFFASE